MCRVTNKVAIQGRHTALLARKKRDLFTAFEGKQGMQHARRPDRPTSGTGGSEWWASAW